MAGEGATPDDLKIELQWPSDASRDLPFVHLDPLGNGTDDLADRKRQADAGDRAREDEAGTPGSDAGAVPDEPGQASPPTTREEPQQAARLARLAEETAATRARLDTLTDAVITMRSFFDERVGDVGDVVARSTTKLSGELTTAMERLPATTEVDIDGILEQSRAGLAAQLTEAVAVTQGVLADQLDQALVRLAPASPDLEQQLVEVQRVVASSVEEAFARLNGQVGRHLDEVIAESRTQTVERVEQAIVETQDRLLTHLERLSTAAQRSMADQDRAVRSELERSGTALEQLVVEASTTQAGLGRLGTELAAAAEAQSAGLTSMTEALTSELASLAKDLAASMDRSTDSVRAEAQASSERASADVNRMGDSVAAALNQVADRLERLAVRNADSENVVEAVADALDDVADRVDELDQSARSRHERLTAILAELRADTSKAELRNVVEGLERLEGELTELTSTGGRIEARLARAGGAGRETASTFARLVEASEHQTEQLAEVLQVGPGIQQSLTAVDKRLSELGRVQSAQATDNREALEGVADTVARLATAQAEDLEQIMDAIEAQMEGTSGRSAAQEPVAVQLAEVAKQLEALRRRIPLRGRAPEMSDAAIDALAARLVDRIRATRRPGPRSRPAAAPEE